jgi:hypothetical protein
MEFGKHEVNELAALCNAMKYDIGWVSIDELDDGLYQEDIDRMKHYSKTFENYLLILMLFEREKLLWLFSFFTKINYKFSKL